MPMTSQGCAWVHKMHHGCFSGRKTRKDTTWSVHIVFPSVLKCFLGVQYMYTVHIHNHNHQRKLEFLERQEFFAPTTATMMYYVVVVLV